MKPVEFHPGAADDAHEAAAWYEDVRPGLGAEFHDDLEAALQRIRDNPLLYAAESGAIRICRLHRFPYSIFYEVLGDKTWVAAVGHHRRRPGYWSRRRPG
jgi:plasmid stabilization system protein ParE